ncbi:MAG: COX15/CtaA family protein [Planctomycetota bacterium]
MDRVDVQLAADRHAVLLGGFLTPVLVSAVSYFGRLPGIELPNPVLLGAILVCMIGGGWVTGRITTRPLRAGTFAGLLAGVLALVLLGSVIAEESPNELRDNAAWIVCGFFATSAAAGVLGAAIGSRFPAPKGTVADAVGSFAKVAVAATFVLVVIGGVVTSADAGLAVYDWPTSFEANMFLLPLSKMVGGVFYEHAHRLFGALIGLVTMTFGVYLLSCDRRRWVRVLAVVAMVLVVGQGLLGADRVLRAGLDASGGQDNVSARSVAVVHGVTGQVFLALLAFLAAATSRTWRRLHSHGGAGPTGGAIASLVLVSMLIIQLTLGAMLRHHGRDPWLLWHMGFAFVVFVQALIASLRAQRLGVDLPGFGPTGAVLFWLPLAQIGLGFAAMTVTSPEVQAQQAHAALVVATGHQGLGALLLVTAVVLLAWHLRLVLGHRLESRSDLASLSLAANERQPGAPVPELPR